MGHRRSPKSLVIERDTSCHDGEVSGNRGEVSGRRAASLVGQWEEKSAAISVLNACDDPSL
jgi:hypothetical protein